MHMTVLMMPREPLSLNGPSVKPSSPAAFFHNVFSMILHLSKRPPPFRLPPRRPLSYKHPRSHVLAYAEVVMVISRTVAYLSMHACLRPGSEKEPHQKSNPPRKPHVTDCIHKEAPMPGPLISFFLSLASISISFLSYP